MLSNPFLRIGAHNLESIHVTILQVYGNNGRLSICGKKSRKGFQRKLAFRRTALIPDYRKAYITHQYGTNMNENVVRSSPLVTGEA